MRKAMRFWILVLCMLLIGGLTAARADLVTVGITLTGRIPAGDGTFRTVTPEGEFRVWQNGEEVGVIAAGRQTLTLNSRERIRIEPVPQSFAPEWDLSTAFLTPQLTDDSAQILEITVMASAPQPAPEPDQPEAQPDSNEPDSNKPGSEPAAAPEITPDSNDSNPNQPETQPDSNEPGSNQPGSEPAAAPEITPTPNDSGSNQPEALDLPAAGPTPVPPLPGFGDDAGAGSLRVQVFFDKNGNGSQGDYEYGIQDITIYLLSEDETPITSAVTDADGFALFEKVPAGAYRTRTNLPEGWYFTPYSGDNSLTRNAYSLTPAGHQSSGVFQISSGAEAQQGIAIHSGATSCGGFCWLEDEVDGLYTGNERKASGVKIRLRSKDDDSVNEAVTDADGSWLIGNLRPGYYVVSVEGQSGVMLTRYTSSRGRRSYLTSDNPRRQMELKADDHTVMNIGFNLASVIYGRCYLDANYNGLYDEGELPLPGVKLSVKFKFDEADAASAVSGADGSFILDGMRGNQYQITAVLPSDGSVYTRLLPENPLGNRFTARGDRRDSTVRGLSLADGEQLELNIGAIYPASVSGAVYYDDNFSAALDGGEKPVPGFSVTLLDGEGNAFTAKTAPDGSYTVENLAPGDYTLDVSATPGYAFTKHGEGNAVLNLTGGRGYSEPFPVELGARVSGVDIGMILPGTVRGAVFADLNDNGLRDPEEPGMAGSTVRLLSESEGEAFRAGIGEDGSFLFDAVMPGTYFLEYELPSGAIFARVTNAGNQISESETRGSAALGRSDSFAFAAGQVLDAPACGALTLGCLEGMAFLDHDGSGLREENEEPLAGLTLRLIPSRRELEEVSAVSGGDGSFLLSSLRPDTYTLEVLCPSGFVVSRTSALSLPLTAGSAEQRASLSLPMGKEWRAQCLGVVQPAALAGQVWLDENNNGLFDEGERTPAGTRVTVTDDASGAVFATLVSDEEGRFSAAGMIPGSFTLSTPLGDRTLPPQPGDSSFRREGSALVLRGVSLRENERKEGLLLGLVKYSSVSGRAWIDRGQEIESLPGVKVVMKDPAGAVLASTETDGSGNYRFDHLMPASFILGVTAPEGCVIIEPSDPRLQGSLRSVVVDSTNREGTTDEMTLLMDQDLANLDLGCVLPGRLGDYCWVDLNGDGLQAGDEPGLGGLRIELLRSGAVIAETGTNAYGFYRFVDLYPAEYTLRVYAPKEVKPTKRRTDLPLIASVLEETDAETPLSVPLTVESSRDQYNADLGFVCRVEGVLPPGTGEGKPQDWTPKY